MGLFFTLFEHRKSQEHTMGLTVSLIYIVFFENIVYVWVFFLSIEWYAWKHKFNLSASPLFYFLTFSWSYRKKNVIINVSILRKDFCECICLMCVYVCLVCMTVLFSNTVLDIIVFRTSKNNKRKLDIREYGAPRFFSMHYTVLVDS